MFTHYTKAPRHNESSMCCTEAQQSFQGKTPNISGLNTQFCRFYRHVYELADRHRMPNIVDMSHEASIIDT